MKKCIFKILTIIGGIILVFIVLCCFIFYLLTNSVSNDKKLKEIVIENGENYYSITEELKENNLIKSEFFYKLYIKLYRPKSLQAGKYYLSESMGVKEIIGEFEKGSTYNPDAIRITFKEGINIKHIAKIISENTNNTENDVYNLLKNSEYLDELINKYWFITDDIKNSKLYFSLEGYLFPNTYEFRNKDVSVKEIFAVMLNQMDRILESYRTEIEDSKYSVHQILTLASVVEKEGKTKDFKDVASVFHNRLNINMRLESCATTYYGIGLDFNEVGIATNEMTSNNNPYNTYKITGLPVGPISAPSKSAIEATLNPKVTKNYFFLSDNQGVSYFFETYYQHQQKQSELVSQGKWYR